MFISPSHSSSQGPWNGIRYDMIRSVCVTLCVDSARAQQYSDTIQTNITMKFKHEIKPHINISWIFGISVAKEFQYKAIH